MTTDRSPDQPKETGRKLIASWASIFLDYCDLKARLLTLEYREATGHFIGLLVLSAIMLILALCSVLMYGAFLLYAVSLLLHLAWGWSALICGAVLTFSSMLIFFLLRSRLQKPIFQLTLRDLEKDKEWLTQSRTKNP
jgi:uncharacterized membrane protein YqjE